MSASQFLLGPSHPRVAWTPNRQGKGTWKEQSTQRPSDNNQGELFLMIKRLLQCRKLGVFIPPTLAVHIHFCPYIFNLYQHFRSPRLVISRLAIVELFTSRKRPRIVIGTPPPFLRGSPRSSERDPFLGPQIIGFGSKALGFLGLPSYTVGGPSGG